MVKELVERTVKALTEQGYEPFFVRGEAVDPGMPLVRRTMDVRETFRMNHRGSENVTVTIEVAEWHPYRAPGRSKTDSKRAGRGISPSRERRAEMSKKQEFTGWICRTWVDTDPCGWASEFDRFDTEEEAREFGQKFVARMTLDERAREYEVYKDFTEPF